MKSRFTEKQKFMQPGIWVLSIAISIVPIVGLVAQMVFHKSFGNNPASNDLLFFILLVNFGMLGLFYKVKMETEMDKESIKVRFSPFGKKAWKWDEVKSAETIRYGFVGGWGIRMGTRYGTVYNMGGNKGLAIELKNGKRFLIGTQKEKELEAFIKKYYHGFIYPTTVRTATT